MTPSIETDIHAIERITTPLRGSYKRYYVCVDFIRVFSAGACKLLRLELISNSFIFLLRGDVNHRGRLTSNKSLSLESSYNGSVCVLRQGQHHSCTLDLTYSKNSAFPISHTVTMLQYAAGRLK